MRSCDTSVPSELEMAFALQIVRTKPAGQSMTSYFDEIAQALRSGPANPEGDGYHLDGVAFWSRRFSNSEQENSRLQAKILLIEKELQLKASNRSSRVPSHSKRRKKATELDSLVEEYVTQTPIHPDVKPVLDHLYLIHCAPDDISVASACNRITKPLLSFLEDCPASPSIKQLDMILRLVLTIWRSALSRVNVSQVHLLRIHNACVCIVNTTIVILRTHCAKILEHEIAETSYCDVRQKLCSFAITLMHTGKCSHAPVFKALASATQQAIKDMQESESSDIVRKTSARDVCSYYVRLFGTLDDVVDHEKLYEQYLIRSFQDYGELERDLWSLGIIKGWITFD